MQQKNFNLNKLVENHLLSAGARQNENPKIDFMSDEELGPVSADPALIETLLSAILKNAASAGTEEGGVTLLTRNVRLNGSLRKASSYPETDRYVMLSVTANGGGADKTAGKGLSGQSQVPASLSAVHRIIKQFNGDLRVEKGPGQETSLQIFLPSLE